MKGENKAVEKANVYRINVVLDCAPGGADALAVFYAAFLGWDYSHPAGGGWAAVSESDGGMVFAMQEVEGYAPPVWPQQAGRPGQMVHLDYWVPAEELEATVAFAESLGATLVPQQFYTSSRTLLDPAGHPFCIDTNAPEE